MTINLNPLNLAATELETLSSAARILAREVGLGNLELLERFKLMTSNQATIQQALPDRSQAQQQREIFATRSGEMVAADLAKGDNRTLARFMMALTEANKLNHTLGLSPWDIQVRLQDNPEPPETAQH